MVDVTPRVLDICLHGVKVWIWRRPQDGLLHASQHDFTRFIKEEPVSVIRVPVDTIHCSEAEWRPIDHPLVIAEIERLSRAG